MPGSGDRQNWLGWRLAQKYNRRHMSSPADRVVGVHANDHEKRLYEAVNSAAA